MGFWSTLGKIGGLAVNAIPGVGPLIGAGIGAAASALGGGGGGATGSGAGMLSVDAGKAYNSPAVQQGLDTLQGPKNYLTGVMNGSQEQTQGLLGPEVSTVLSQYDNAAKTAAELGPRGGGRTAILAEAPFKKVGAYGKALAGAKQTALSELPKIGAEEANIGTQQEQLNNQFKLGQAGVNATQNRSILDQQQQRNKAYSDIGSGIGGILTRIITGAKGGSSPSVTDSNLSVNDQYKLGF